MPKSELHLMSGRVASGKSTLAKSLATELSTVLLSEDLWLSKLYQDRIKSVTDYIRCFCRSCPAKFDPPDRQGA